MNKNLKTAFVMIAAIAAMYFIFRFIFIRTVNYEIAGIKIPSRYNMLTGTFKPIINYTGRRNLKTVEMDKTGKMGLSDEQVVFAKLRWAIFEEWANSHPEYKSWQENPAVFKKANDDFKKQIKDRR